MRTAKNRLLRLKRAKLAALRGFEQHPFLRLRRPIFLTPFRIRPGGRSVRNVLPLAIQDLQSRISKAAAKEGKHIGYRQVRENVSERVRSGRAGGILFFVVALKAYFISHGRGALFFYQFFQHHKNTFNILLFFCVFTLLLFTSFSNPASCISIPVWVRAYSLNFVNTRIIRILTSMATSLLSMPDSMPFVKDFFTVVNAAQHTKALYEISYRAAS